MKRSRFLVAAILLAAALPLHAADSKYMSVAVQKTQVRASAGYLGAILGVLNYGDRVTVLAQPAGAPKDWLYVLAPDGKLRGWVNASALTAKKVELSSSSGSVQKSASSGDVALAGKGFNSDVEAEYKSEGGLDYTWVDRMEAFVVPSTTVIEFMAEGGLSAGGIE